MKNSTALLEKFTHVVQAWHASEYEQEMLLNNDIHNNWIRRPNSYFNGKSAIEVMLEKDTGLELVSRYLKALRV